jgi:hypothetical protein
LRVVVLRGKQELDSLPKQPKASQMSAPSLVPSPGAMRAGVGTGATQQVLNLSSVITAPPRHNGMRDNDMRQSSTPMSTPMGLMRRQPLRQVTGRIA